MQHATGASSGLDDGYEGGGYATCKCGFCENQQDLYKGGGMQQMLHIGIMMASLRGTQRETAGGGEFLKK